MHQKQGTVIKMLPIEELSSLSLKHFETLLSEKKITLKHRNFMEIRQVKDVMTEILIPLDIIIQRNNL